MSKLSILPPKIRSCIVTVLHRTILLSRAAKWQLCPPTKAQKLEPSMMLPAEYDEGRLTSELLNDVQTWLSAAAKKSFSHLSSRVSSEQLNQINLWPGEHYRLLSGIIEQRKPKLMVEIGTYTGLSALVMRDSMKNSGKLVTYDLMAWNDFSQTVLRQDDFGNHLEQRLGDLANETYFDSQKDTMLEADVFFIDAPKNGVFEQVFMELFFRKRKKPCLLIFDDIRMLTMLELWRSFAYPKADMTGFGHWSGTGIVEFTGK